MEEIEIRGKINKDDFERLEKLISEKGRFLKHYHRLSVDVSPGFDPKTKSWWQNLDQIDLRIKKTDGKEKISVKVGDFDSKERQEIEIDIKEGEMIDTLKLFEALGYKQGMIYFWESWEYEYEDFEVKLTKYSEDYFSWEIESRASGEDPNLLAEKLNLQPFSKSEFKDEIDWQNQNLHQLYSLEKVEKLLRDNF